MQHDGWRGFVSDGLPEGPENPQHVHESLKEGGNTPFSCPQGGEWCELWEAAEAVPASRQKPLMDPQKEGERVLHWFEHKLLPETLWSLLLPIAFSAAAACLASSSSCRLPLLSSELKK